MNFEVKIVRQMIPENSVRFGGVPINDASMLDMMPPDQSGQWRFREFKILDPMQPSTPISSSYTPAGVTPFECVVIWEKYKE